MLSFRRKIEVASNIAIIIAATLFIGVLIKSLIRSGNLNGSNNAPSSIRRLIDKDGLAGKKINILGVDWSKSERTLVLAVQPKCRFCTESAPFYKQLAERQFNHSGLKLLALSQFPVDVTKKYLDTLGVPIEEIKQAPFDSIGIAGTPTLLLIDRSGTVTNLWFGRLKQEQEAEVLAQLQ